MEITRHVLPENIFTPHPPYPPKEGLWLGPPPFLQPTLFSSYSSYVLLKILALKELCNEIDQKIKQRDIKITTQNMKRRYKKITANTKGCTLGLTSRRLRWIAITVGFENFCQPSSFSKFIFVVCSLWNNALEIYLFNMKLWFCHSQVNLFLKFHSK